MNTGAVGRSRPARLQRPDQRRLEVQPDGLEVGRVLGLRVDADLSVAVLWTAACAGPAPRRRSGSEQPVVDACCADATPGSRSLARSVLISARVKSSVNQPVSMTPSTDLVVLRLANSGWSATSVVPADLVLVPDDQHVILGRDQVGLDVVGAHPGGQLVTGQRVFRAVPGGAAVADHQGCSLNPASLVRRGRDCRKCGHGGRGDGHYQEEGDTGKGSHEKTAQRDWMTTARRVLDREMTTWRQAGSDCPFHSFATRLIG